MNHILQDLRYGFRLLRKTLGMSAAAALALALGIGANIAIFSLVDALWLRPLPVPDADRVVTLYTGMATSHGESGEGATSYPDLIDLRAQSQSLADLVASERRGAFLDDHGTARQLLVSAVSDNYFALFAVKPAAGRLFAENEFRQQNPTPVALISYRFWQEHFAGDRAVLGQVLTLTGSRYTIVGVLPRDFRGTQPLLDPELWVPLTAWHQNMPTEAARMSDRRQRDFEVFARLRPGVEMRTAAVELAGIQQRLASAYPATNAGRKFTIVFESQSHGTMLAVLGAVFLSIALMVLLIACADVANLLLARGEYRRHEVATRLALGASRWRIVQQMLTESVLLVTLGVAFALVVAYCIIASLPALAPPVSMPFSISAVLDVRALLFGLAVGIVTACVCGVAPALQASKARPIQAMKDESGQVRGRERGRNILIVAQITMSLVLIVVAGLLVRTVVAAQNAHPGFDARGSMLLVDIYPDFRSANLGSSNPMARLHTFYDDLESEIPGLPGVTGFGIAGRLPLSGHGDGANRRVVLPGADAAHLDGVPVNETSVSEGYFNAIGTRLLRGRVFTRADREGSPRVAVINQSMARRFWPNQDPVGQHFRVPGAAGFDCEVVGLVEDGKYGDLGEDVRPYMFLAWHQEPWGGATLVIATASDPGSLAVTVRERLRAMDKNVAVAHTVTMRQHMRDAVYSQRLAAILAGGLGSLGIVLAAVGLYGVISYVVGRRTHEIGIRVALGASRADILRLFLRRGLAVALIGIALGTAGALGAGKVLDSLIYGVSPRDPLTFVTAGVLLLLIVLTAAYLPARRAARIHPMEALRHE